MGEEEDTQHPYEDPGQSPGSDLLIQIPRDNLGGGSMVDAFMHQLNNSLLTT